MIIINAQTINESIFVHLAGTFEKGIEWILKHGNDWFDEEYCFFAYEVTVDKDDYIDEGLDNAFYINLKGVMSKDNPLYR